MAEREFVASFIRDIYVCFFALPTLFSGSLVLQVWGQLAVDLFRAEGILFGELQNALLLSQDSILILGKEFSDYLLYSCNQLGSHRRRFGVCI